MMQAGNKMTKKTPIMMRTARAVAPDSELVEVLRRAGATVLDVTLTGIEWWTDASLRPLVPPGAGMTVVLATVDVCGSADACVAGPMRAVVAQARVAPQMR